MQQKRVSLILILLFIWIGADTFGQFFETGQAPSSIRWREIKTDHFQIIFDQQNEATAQRFANILEYIYDFGGYSLGKKPRNISVLIDHQTVNSNGVVVLAPRRMEIISTPPQESYAQNWLEQLAVHEFRHVVQLDLLNQGITKWLYYIFGEQIAGAVAGHIPMWLYEGDATYAETAMSQSGRGREASFLKEYKAMWIENRDVFSYQKALLGSFKDYVPDHYKTGYILNNQLRHQFDSTLPAKIFNRVGSNPLNFFPVYTTFKRETGLNNRQLYNAVFEKIGSDWEREYQFFVPSSYHQINGRKGRDYTNYTCAQAISDSVFVSHKYGIDQTLEIVMLTPNGNEKIIARRGQYAVEKFSYANGFIFYNENIPHPRWGKKNYSVIKKMNLSTGKITPITRKSRYFAPAVSPSGKWIATVENDEANGNYLVVLDAANGNVIKRIATPQNNAIQFPSWNKDETEIVVTMISNQGKSILVFDAKMEVFSNELVRSPNNINYPIFYKHNILFQADFNGTDNLYLLDREKDTVFSVTSSKYGASYPTIDEVNNKIIYADYSVDGYNLVTIPISDSVSLQPYFVSPKIDSLARFEAKMIISDSIPNIQFASQRYSKILHSVNIHSWIPVYYDYSFNISSFEAYPGVTFLSQNILGTLVTQTGYAYKEKSSVVYSQITYKGWYPVIDLKASYGEPDELASNIQNAPQNFELSPSVYLPLDFSRNGFNRGLQPGLIGSYTHAVYYDYLSQQYKQGNGHLQGYIYGYNYRRMGHRDFLPRWGQTFEIFGIESFFRQNLKSQMFGVKATFYLPGVLPHHVFKFNGGYQENRKQVLLSGKISPARGYYHQFAENSTTIQSEYQFPICYPDAKLYAIINIARIRGLFFYDYLSAKNVLDEANRKYISSYNFSSLGAELVADVQWFNIAMPITMGGRIIYLPREQKTIPEVVLTMNL